MNRDTYARAFRSALGQVGTIFSGYARLGRGDGSGTILADLSRRLVWYFDNQGTAVAPVVMEMNLVALNSAAMEGQRVRLGFPPYAPETLHVIGFDSGESVAAFGGVTPEEQLSAAVAAPAQPLRIAAQNPPDTSLWVQSGAYLGGGRWNWFAGGSIDVSTQIAALTSGQHQMGMICLNGMTGALAVVTNTAVTGSSKNEFDASTLGGILIPANYLPLGAVYLFYGQAEVREDTTRNDLYREIETRVGKIEGLPLSTANVSNPPTDAELDAAFGTPAQVGAGFVSLVDDNGAGTAGYVVWSDGANWWYVGGTKAT